MRMPGILTTRSSAVPGIALLAAFLLLPFTSSAEERLGRPWAHHYTPPIESNSSTGQRGYLGRYNPWGSKKGEEEVKDKPRYRQREDERRTESPYWGGGYQPYSYPPGGSAYRGYTPWGSDDNYPSQQAPYPGYSPWDGGQPRYYGESYDMRPDTGILWSDMWRW